MTLRYDWETVTCGNCLRCNRSEAWYRLIAVISESAAIHTAVRNGDKTKAIRLYEQAKIAGAGDKRGVGSEPPPRLVSRKEDHE